MAHPTTQLLDTHVHIWQLSRFHYHWMEKGSALYKDFMLEHICDEMKALDVAGGILMEATNTPEEIAWLLEVCEHSEGIWGVIGWIHLDQLDAPQQIAYYAQFKRFKGVRLNWLEARPHPETLDAAMQTLQDHKLVVDVLAQWEQLPAISDFVRTHAQVSFVIEHLGGARLVDSQLSEWRATMRLFASLPNVTLKLSGYTTPKPPSQETLQGYVQTALDLFGASHVMFGSNFPICLQTTSYSETVSCLQHTITSNATRQAVFFETAKRVYGL